MRSNLSDKRGKESEPMAPERQPAVNHCRKRAECPQPVRWSIASAGRFWEAFCSTLCSPVPAGRSAGAFPATTGELWRFARLGLPLKETADEPRP